MRVRLAAMIGCVLATAGQAVVAEPVGPLVVGQVPAATIPGDGLADGSRVVVFDPDEQGEPLSVLTPDFAAAGRPVVSWDARTVLFVGRLAAGDPLGIWETSLDGGPARRIIRSEQDCVEAIYLSSLYTITDDAPSRKICFRKKTQDGIDALFISGLDGEDQRQITFNPLGARDPLLLGDGRLVFCSPVPAPAPRANGTRPTRTVLYTMGVDGADLQAFAAAHAPRARRSMPVETDDGRVVFVQSATENPLAGETLVAVRTARSLHEAQVVAEEPEASYHSPAAWPGGQLLVSYRMAPTETFDLWLLDLATGRRVERILESDDWHEVHASPVLARPIPPGRSSVVDSRVSTGVLFGLDAFLTDRIPDGHRIPRERIGKLEVLRVTTTGGFREQVLGTVPVEDDGSFFMQVPARTALRLRTRDNQDRVSFSMESWFWVMPGERRGCIGCHENRELTPPNRHVLALRRPPHVLE